MQSKNVLITGASRGIGRAAALEFIKHGCHVWINCRKSVDALREVHALCESIAPGCCHMVPGDVGNPDDVREIFRQIEADCDGIDILINNAGVAHIGLLSDMTDEQWMQIIQTNLSSAFYCSRAAIPHMVHEKAGKIVQISSMWGRVGASCEVAYSASKAGIHGFTKALAKELAPSNIQVNAIACGVIDTEMNSLLSEEDKALLSEDIPAGRFGTPEEVASLIFQLTQMPSYVTGQIMGIDGAFNL
jgi:3-oxoacyl-[acyl-carrier protein] reductase